LLLSGPIFVHVGLILLRQSFRRLYRLVQLVYVLLPIQVEVLLRDVVELILQFGSSSALALLWHGNPIAGLLVENWIHAVGLALVDQRLQYLDLLLLLHYLVDYVHAFLVASYFWSDLRRRKIVLVWDQPLNFSLALDEIIAVNNQVCVVIFARFSHRFLSV
jgi:hypothetical protein